MQACVCAFCLQRTLACSVKGSWQSSAASFSSRPATQACLAGLGMSLPSSQRRKASKAAGRQAGGQAGGKEFSGGMGQ